MLKSILFAYRLALDTFSFAFISHFFYSPHRVTMNRMCLCHFACLFFSRFAFLVQNSPKSLLNCVETNGKTLEPERTQTHRPTNLLQSISISHRYKSIQLHFQNGRGIWRYGVFFSSSSSQFTV